MNRNELLSRYHYTVPEEKKKRVIIHTDAKCEADDQFAIMHHLLTPTLEVRGIIGAHFEAKYDFPAEAAQADLRGTSAIQSLEEIRKVLGLAGVTDVFSCIGAVRPLDQGTDFVRDFMFPDGTFRDDDVSRKALGVLLPDSPGAEFIIQEAQREDDTRPLYLVCQGGLTDPAVALLKEPEIASKITIIWIGGGMYPYGNFEFNLCQDVRAAQVVFSSNVPLWQIPQDTYSQMGTSLTELDEKIRPCGEIGAYLFQEMVDYNLSMSLSPGWPQGESWSLGDSCGAAVLISEGFEGRNYTVESAPIINDDQSYTISSAGRDIRIYHEIDTRAAMEDFFSKMKIVYGKQGV